LPINNYDLTQASDNYYEISAWKIKQLSTQGDLLSYKGQNLELQKIHAIFLKEDLLPLTCEVTPDSLDCLELNIQQLKDNFELWIALETVENKFFYSKLSVGKTTSIDQIVKEEAQALWKKLIKKEVFKDIDNLTVAKPVKIDLATFKEILRSETPKIYAEEKFVPFRFSIGFWSKDRFTWEKDRRNINCNFPILEEHTSILQTFPCFEEVIDAVKAGDILSFYLYIEEDFLKDISPNRLKHLRIFFPAKYFAWSKSEGQNGHLTS